MTALPSNRVLFLGTPEFSVPGLQALVAEGFHVAAVYTQPDRPAGRGLKVEPPPAKRAAEALCLPVFQPATLRNPDVWEQMRSLRPHVGVVAAYGKLLPPEVLSIPARGCVNIHPSLLPKHRGPAPVASAILAGDTETGVTIMLLDEGMDSGPVIAQERAPIQPGDTTGTLTQRLAHHGARLLVRVLPQWLAGALQAMPQDDAAATLCKKLGKEDGILDWSRPSRQLWFQVRACNPWPGAYTQWKGRMLKVWEAEPWEDGAGQAGRVVAVDGGCGVCTGAGVLRLTRVQLEGKAALSAGDFLNGARDFIGSRLPS
ncbi:MAG: methionyl-tRNA formyltransferase [Chloroflexi bacterium]|nr:methionyl-tRNA formyltransferase [Chloroflexota bacterium]